MIQRSGSDEFADTTKSSRRTGGGEGEGTKVGSPLVRQTVEKACAARTAYAAEASAGTRQVIADIRSSGVETLNGIAKALQTGES